MLTILKVIYELIKIRDGRELARLEQGFNEAIAKHNKREVIDPELATDARRFENIFKVLEAICKRVKFY